MGLTDEAGSARLQLAGIEGTKTPLAVRCPPGYRQPAAPIPVLLKTLALGSRLPEYSASCAPERRRIVVAVRAENGAALPILYLGREIARTDSLGTGHVLLELEPRSQVELTLATDAGDSARLRPKNPSLKVIVGDRDEIFSFAPRFSAQDAPQKAPRVAVEPAGPIRL